MRTAYHQELAYFQDRLGDLAQLAETAIQEATKALLDNDIEAARGLTAQGETIARLHRLVDADAVTLIARQQPVASDLRMIVAGLRMSGDLDRMGALARHIAEIVERRHPTPAVPEALRSTIAEMGELAQRMAAKTREALANQDPAAARKLDAQDNAMDRLTTALEPLILACEPPVTLTEAMDLALLGRFYERFADHTVALATRVAYLTGAPQEDLSV
ncbi:phosphate signaling complex protein PhoU [Amycolatopsis pithecellobii]|uniref:Phosphate-specific transport system accessory protein PhoU n=1 Tax=Amycolatopsis pithecellobii TaxID=664692 RepID=A0A6N7YRL2_9PSEU|nr:phosphate signaling complex protein PhoU [Amycolatopsis pithecellobii]MTD54602.1 phosphate signaling complex protein PhoU [Amycolatopsis pithecellobii]